LGCERRRLFPPVELTDTLPFKLDFRQSYTTEPRLRG
jgi:hypothetical protein